MNPLLIRQLRKHCPAIDPADPQYAALLQVVSLAYDEFQRDRAHVEHTLEVASNELTEANERLRAESEAKIKSLSFYHQQILELQQGMILCFRRNYRGFAHSLCRGHLARKLGWDVKKVEGAIPADFLPPAPAAKLNDAYTRAWAGEECTVEITLGDIVFLALLRPWKEAGAVREVIVSCVEITALKEYEQQMRLAKERAESADRAKSEFLAVMSHEIRTPLNAILGFTQLLQSEPVLAGQPAKWLDMIAQNGDALLELINDILDFSKIEAGMLEMNPREMNLGELIEDIAETYSPKAAEKAILFETKMDPDVPLAIIADRMRLRQILANLVGNAVKFTKQGFVRLEVAALPVHSASDNDERLLRFMVSDSGVGIKPEYKEHMFKPFSQADSSTTRAFGGTGLGLAICKRLARLHGGDVDYVSECGKGSVFHFTIKIQSLLPSLNAAAVQALLAESFPNGTTGH